MDAVPVDPRQLGEMVARALAEDIGDGDITTDATVPGAPLARARILQKAPGVVYGLDAAREAMMQAGAETFEPLVAEGAWRDEVPVEIARIAGPAQALLKGERTALNFLCHLSGVATVTARFVSAVEGTGARILDTRKTTPGLRALEKAAVAAGGGINHRSGLYDAVLVKENHIAMAGGVGEAIRRVREALPSNEVEIECRNADEVAAALAGEAERLLLDNMSLEGLRAAVATRDQVRPATKLEASGGVTLANVAEIAATGVDLISVGALTHSAPALDLSMEIEPVDDRANGQ